MNGNSSDHHDRTQDRQQLPLTDPDGLETVAIDVLNLPFDAYGALRRSQIHTIADLLLYTEEDLTILAPGSSQIIITALKQTLNLTLTNDLKG